MKTVWLLLSKNKNSEFVFATGDMAAFKKVLYADSHYFGIQVSSVDLNSLKTYEERMRELDEHYYKPPTFLLKMIAKYAV